MPSRIYSIAVPFSFVRKDTIASNYRELGYVIINDPAKRKGSVAPQLTKEALSTPVWHNLTLGSFIGQGDIPGHVSMLDFTALFRFGASSYTVEEKLATWVGKQGGFPNGTRPTSDQLITLVYEFRMPSQYGSELLRDLLDLVVGKILRDLVPKGIKAPGQPSQRKLVDATISGLAARGFFKQSSIKPTPIPVATSSTKTKKSITSASIGNIPRSIPTPTTPPPTTPTQPAAVIAVDPNTLAHMNNTLDGICQNIKKISNYTASIDNAFTSLKTRVSNLEAAFNDVENIATEAVIEADLAQEDAIEATNLANQTHQATALLTTNFETVHHTANAAEMKANAAATFASETRHLASQTQELTAKLTTFLSKSDLAKRGDIVVFTEQVAESRKEVQGILVDLVGRVRVLEKAMASGCGSGGENKDGKDGVEIAITTARGGVGEEDKEHEVDEVEAIFAAGGGGRDVDDDDDDESVMVEGEDEESSDWPAFYYADSH